MKRAAGPLSALLLAMLMVFAVTACDSDEDAPQLASGHPGYHKTNCLGCHSTDSHNKGLMPGDCAECHGNNGAPAGHGSTANCLDCHASGGKAINADHVAANHDAPGDCNACH
jgi:hypothetical protein